MRALALSCLAGLAPALAHADSGDRFDGGTLAVQAGGGLLGAAAGGAVLGLAGFGVGAAVDGPQGSIAPLAIGAMGIVVGGFVGTTVAVKLVGDHRDATGGWLGTTLGMVGGAAVLGLVAASTRRMDVPWPVQVAVGATLLLGGPIVGYQLTNDGPDRTTMLALPVARF